MITMIVLFMSFCKSKPTSPHFNNFKQERWKSAFTKRKFSIILLLSIKIHFWFITYFRWAGKHAIQLLYLGIYLQLKL